MEKNLVPPTDEFIKTLADKQGLEYNLGKKGADRFYAENGSPIYPPNDGAIGNIKIITLRAGSQLVDRYGRTTGNFVSHQGTPQEQRSLSQDAKKQKVRVYRIVKDIENVGEGVIAPWFGDPGGGIQYKLPKSVKELSDYLERVIKNDF